MLYTVLVGFQHERESLFGNLVVNITKVQTLRSIILLGRDFNAHATTLLDTINTSDFYELLRVPEFVETEQLDIVVKRQNRDASVGDWGHECLDLCCDVRLLILNGRTPGDESTVPLIWQMGGTPLSIILLTHLQFGKLLHSLR